MSNQGFVEVTSQEAPHLGGNLLFGDPRTFAPNVWSFVIERFAIQSVLDIGSGMGHASRYFHRKGLEVIAVDGLAANVRHAVYPTLLHDLTTGPVQARVDLVHCQEVVEHIEERFLGNLLGSLLCGRYILMTNALPGQGGHHHVNEQPTQYWVDHLTARGCQLLAADSTRVRNLAAAEGAVYFAQTGLVFANSARF
jgi:SAM-dependent methyltransferase